MAQISERTLDSIKRTDKASDHPLLDDANREIAIAAAKNPEELIEEFNENRGRNDAMPVSIG